MLKKSNIAQLAKEYNSLKQQTAKLSTAYNKANDAQSRARIQLIKAYQPAIQEELKTLTNWVANHGQTLFTTEISPRKKMVLLTLWRVLCKPGRIHMHDEKLIVCERYNGNAKSIGVTVTQRLLSSLGVPVPKTRQDRRFEIQQFLITENIKTVEELKARLKK